jgi:hypothetical protein
MIRLWLILALVATQVLSGSGAAYYVCLNGDGSYCCIDAGPDACTCCHEHDSPPADACADAAGTCGHHHDDDAAPPAGSGVTLSDACDGTHIPVMASADQALRATRSAAAANAERLALGGAWLPSWGNAAASVVFAAAPARWGGPPTVPDFAVTVVSTVALRC